MLEGEGEEWGYRYSMVFYGIAVQTHFLESYF